MPVMDSQSLINTVIGTVLAVGGWFARQLWDAVEKLKNDVHQIEIDLPRHYLRKDEFRDGIAEIKDILREIFVKIDDLKDRKADK